MCLSKILKVGYQIRVSVEVAVLVLASTLLCHDTALAASTGSRWSQQPSWASSEPDAPSKKSILREPNYGKNLAPFLPGTNNLAIDIGQVFLMGDLSSRYSDSLGTQIHYTYGVSDIFGFDSSFGYSSHADGKFSMTTLLAGLRTNLAWYDKVVPYVVFGLGFYRPSYELDLLNSVSPVLFGVHLGPGVSLEVTKQLFFGASLTFHDMFGTSKLLEDKTRLDVGGTYTTFFLNAGVTF